MLSGVDTFVFDKTGTLTEGRFELDTVNPAGISESELLGILALAESYSNHPIARSILEAYGGELDHSRISDVREISGKGICAVVDGRSCGFGNAALMRQMGVSSSLATENVSTVHVCRDGEYLGYVTARDKIKSGSREAISALRSRGVKHTVMLTGDNERVARDVADKVGVDEVHAQLLPADKVEKFEEILKTGSGRVAFVGDGINDAPVLTRADVGIAMGALGSDAAIEAADVVLMDDDPRKLATAVSVARKTMGIVRANIAFALGAKLIVLALGALGIANMWLAVFGDVGILIIAILNSMRAAIVK